MNTFRVAYPSSRGLPGQVFRPVIEPRTYLRAFHLLAMFPLGIAYFVSLVTLLALGGSLIWTFPGALIILIAIFGSRVVGDAEAVMVSNVSDIEIRRPPWRTEGAESWRSRLWIRLIDPTTWTGIVYLFVQFPLGIGAFVSLVVSFSVAGAFIASPLIVQITGDSLDMDFAGWSVVLDRPVETLWLIPVGLLILLLTVHFVTAASALHAMWAKFMLGSRAKAVAATHLPPEPPDLEHAEPAPRPNAPRAGATGSVRPFGRISPQGGIAINERPAPDSADGVPLTVPMAVSPAVRSLIESLTQRESEIVLHLAAGLTNAEIAERCFISQGTVKTHVKRILAKLQLHDRTQVVVFAYETGLVAPQSGQRARAAVNA